jgi:hypothetical protein
MGNLIVTIGSIFVPLVSEKLLIPFIFHPLRYGGIPWSEPGITASILTWFLNIAMLIILSTISGMMSTTRECNKKDIMRSIKRSTWVILGYFIGNFVSFFLPIIKAPILLATMWLPYAGYIAHGSLVSIFVLLFGAMGNAKLRSEIC